MCFKLFPYYNISFAACESVRMRKPLDTDCLSVKLPNTITSYPADADK